MKYIINSIIIAIVVLSLAQSSNAATSESIDLTLSQNLKTWLQERLVRFFDRVDTYSAQRQSELYSNVQQKIPSSLSRFEESSNEYQIIKIVDIYVTKKLSLDASITNSQILWHVIFNQALPVIQDSLSEDDNISQEIEIPTETNGDITKEDDEMKNEKDEDTDEIFRPDLFTDDLNEIDKNIVAWSAKWVLQLEVRADLEWIKSETVEFRFNKNIDNIGLTGRVYYNWIFKWESSQSDAQGNTLSIKNIEDLIIGTDTGYVQLEIVTQSIWENFVWRAIDDLMVISTRFSENTWIITGDDIRDTVNGQDSRSFNIVPSDISVSLESKLGKNIGTAEIKITPEVWVNNDNGNIFNTFLESITFQVSSFSLPGSISIFNSRGEEIWSWNITSSWNTTIDLIPDNISSSWEIYTITTSAEANFIISQDWFGFSVGGQLIESNLERQILLGQR